MKRSLISLFLCFLIAGSLFATGCRAKTDDQDAAVSSTPAADDVAGDATTSNCRHKVVVDEAKHATFSKSGLTEGSHCSICGAVIKKQTVIPALGGDMVVGTDYYDRDGKTTYRYSYSFTLYEGDRFNLTTLKVGSDESYDLSGEEGKFNYLDHGVYELIFDSGREKMYAKIVDGKFEFCKKDGSSLSDGSDKRPQGTTEVDITPRSGNSVYGYYDLANNKHGKSMQELYYRMYAACEAFVTDNRDVKAQNGNYTIDKINLDYYVLNANEAVAVWKVFLVENPRYYWLSNTISLAGGMLSVNIDAAYAKADYRKTCDAAIEAMSKDCKAKIKTGMSQLQKAMAIHDFVLGRMNYAYKADGKTPQTAIWAHNLMGSAEKKSGVCEAYAKTYQYLCLLNGLECMVATGFNQESHAWNVVSIDKKWYGVDCTFDETNTDAVSYNCFGMSASHMENDYKTDSPDKSGTEYLYKLPTLSKQGVELVDLYKNNALVGAYANVDAALAAMTDEKAEYEVQLYQYDKRGALLMSFSSVEHHVAATQTPKVKRLTFRGKHIDLGNGYATRMMLFLDKALKLRSDLDIYNLELAGDGSLNLADKAMRCQGVSNMISVPVTGSMEDKSPSKIEVNTKEHIEFWREVKVHTFRQGESDYRALFRGTTEIKEAYTWYFNVYIVSDDPISVRVETLHAYTPDGPVRVQVQGPAKLYIGDIRTEYELADIEIKFGQKKEMAAVTVGKISCTYLYVNYETKVDMVSTDMSGNEVGSWSDRVKPTELKGTILTLGNSSFHKQVTLTIYDYTSGNRTEAYHGQVNTQHFSLNSNNQVVFTP